MPALGAGARKSVRVRVPPPAPIVNFLLEMRAAEVTGCSRVSSSSGLDGSDGKAFDEYVCSPGGRRCRGGISAHDLRGSRAACNRLGSTPGLRSGQLLEPRSRCLPALRPAATARLRSRQLLEPRSQCVPACRAAATARLRSRQLLEPRSQCVRARGASATAAVLARTTSSGTGVPETDAVMWCRESDPAVRSRAEFMEDTRRRRGNVPPATVGAELDGMCGEPVEQQVGEHVGLLIWNPMRHAS